MKTNFNLESNLGYLQAHLNTVIKRHNKYIQVSYKVGSVEKGSPGVRVLLKTIKGRSYVLKIRANLVEGDRAFVYCESVKPTEQLVPRKYKIGNEEVTYVITFKAISDQSYVGMLFFNNDVDYVLRIHEFVINEKSDQTETSSTNSQMTAESNGVIIVAGPVGPTGPAGEPGDRGKDGVNGLPGQTGPEGPKGPMGAKGDKGDIGEKGFPGPRGIQGEQGPIGLKGNVGPTGPIGPEGPAPNFVAVADLNLDQPCSVPEVIVFNLKDCTFYECDGTKFVPVCSVMGPTGPSGADGANGADGRTGRQGPTGEKGCPGPQGKQGHRGDPGERGCPGEKGVSGPTGETGKKGDKGEHGPTGTKGPKGDPGPTNGPPGRRGPRGEIGEKGHRGFACWDEIQVSKDMKVMANFGMNSDGLPLDPFNTDFGNVGPDPTHFSLGFGGCVVIDVGFLLKGYINITQGVIGSHAKNGDGPLPESEQSTALAQVQAKVSVSKLALAWDSPDWISIGETNQNDGVVDLAVPFTFRYVKIADCTELKDVFQQVKPAIEGFTIKNIVLRGDCLGDNQAIEKLIHQLEPTIAKKSQVIGTRIFTLPKMETVSESQNPLVDEFMAMTITGDSFKLWGTMHYKMDSPTMFAWNFPMPVDGSFQSQNKSINFKSVSGILSGVDTTIEGEIESPRSITGTVNMTDTCTMIFKVGTKPHVDLNLNFIIHGNFL